VTGTNGAIFLFDERASTFISRTDALGMHVSDRLKSGQVSLKQIEPGDMSPGEFSYRVRVAVENEGARVILIDSLNGYLNAIPQVEAPLVRMHELLSYLNERGVVTLLVVAQHGIVGSNMATPLDVSYLADTVVLLRFFESAGVVRRAVSVMKKRIPGCVDRRAALHRRVRAAFQMMDGSPDAARVLIFAPIGRDANLTAELLSRAGISCQICHSMNDVCLELARAAGAILLTEEALSDPRLDDLAEALTAQPPWSDISILLFAGSDRSEASLRTLHKLEVLRNVTLLDRPIRTAAVVSTVRAALRGRQRQYELRDTLVALQRARIEAEHANRLKDESWAGWRCFGRRVSSRRGSRASSKSSSATQKRRRN
jgi:hypothetical protein